MVNPETFQSGMLARLERSLQIASSNSSQAHGRFLDVRRSALEQLAGMIARQIPGAGPARPSFAPKALFSSEQLDEFGRGSVAKCLGSTYLPFENQRTPRIPNGDLKLMSRITAVDGQPGVLAAPASVTAELDVPVDAWYLRENNFSAAPYSVLMEIALQPCGFLSAYLGSLLKFPPVDLYFRNLDGYAQVLAEVSGGCTLTTQARLLSSVFSGDTMIQRYAFEVFQGSQLVFAGESAFGYFTKETMARQVGLDGGRETAPLQEQSAQAGEWIYLPTVHSQGRAGQFIERRGSEKPGHLDFLERVFVSSQGGKYGQGYVYAVRENDPQDWYYNCHFYQDPVMPGSLGVEAVLQALQAFAQQQGRAQGMRAPRCGLPQGRKMVWKYRGQIVPANRVMKLEAHIARVEPSENGTIVTADASVWADGIRIYELQHAVISVLEG